MHFLTDRTAHITGFDGPVINHWLEWKRAQTAKAFTIQDRSAMQEDQNLDSRVLYLPVPWLWQTLPEPGNVTVMNIEHMVLRDQCKILYCISNF